MPVILVAECKQEVSTFNPVPSSYADFVIARGSALADYHRPRRSELGGALAVFAADPSIQVVPTYGARFITSGGILVAADFDRIRGEFLAALQAAPRPDAAYFCLHGAMAAENELDPEGALLAGARQILGPEVPIVTSLDLHGIPTDRTFAESDAVVMYHTYPHVDFFETGERAALLLLRILRGEVRPVTATCRIPALVRGDELITASGYFGTVVREAQRFEHTPPGLVGGMFIGNPFTDVPELASYSVAVADGDEAAARRCTLRLAEAFWAGRARMQWPLQSLDAAVRLAAEARGEGTAVFVDAADATSSGASGDSTAILHELRRQHYDGRVLAPLVDPEAVAAAWQAGVGAVLSLPVGGKLDPERFAPLPVRARVRLLSDGRFQSESFGDAWDGGPTVVLEADPFTLVVTSRPVSLYDRSLFYAHGRDPRRFDAVIVKSPHCERHMYADWASRMIPVDAPGASSANLPRLGHQRCRRPMYPLDPECPFTPEVRIFRRRLSR